MALRRAAWSSVRALPALDRVQGLFLGSRPRASRPLRLVLGLALAATGTATAALVQAVVLPQPSVAPFVFFYTAVAVVAWLAGRGAGLLTILLSACAADWLFLGPRDLAASPAELSALLLFVVGAIPIDLLCGQFGHALQKAREREGGLRALADAMPHLVWAARADGTVEYTNERWSGFAGLEPLPDGSWSWLGAVHPDDRAVTRDEWQRAVTSGREYRVEHRLQLSDGTFRWHLSRAVPVRDAAGRVQMWYGSATDIEDQKRTQESLQNADRRKNEFLGVLSHELRNPLAPIRSGLYIAARVPPESEQGRRALAVMERQVTQLTRLVDDLLDVTRIARGKIRLHRERVDLGALVRQVVEDHEELFEERGLALELAAADEALPVDADPARLAQVVGNLLQNAAKFTPAGARTTVTVRPAGAGWAEIAVADTGRGIPPDVLAHLFEPFVQAQTTLDRSAGGLGLGLALVKALVELHGGTVTASNEAAGRGARFVVTVPREPSPARPSPSPEHAPERCSRRRILVVEDNVDAAETLKGVLELEGHVVALAHAGDEAVQEAHEFRPDAVICDIGLPGMDGFEVARAMRADPALASVKLIALSGHALSEDAERARAAGFDLHLAKPPDLAALGRSIAGPG